MTDEKKTTETPPPTGAAPADASGGGADSEPAFSAETKGSPARPGPVTTSALTQPAPPTELVAAEFSEFEDDGVEFDDGVSSTASLSDSILEYRHIHGRRYHSAKHDTEYFTPNDDRQSMNIDITHHYMTMLIDNRLTLAPIEADVQMVLDIGTGNGTWAIDFADENPGAEITGTDLSPMMPTWVPPNVRFEIDDATKPWTWEDNTFDFVHIRFLAGAIKDWPALMKEAYRVCKPGGWVESGEFDPRFMCDDGTADNQEAMKLWNDVFNKGGEAMGTPFTVIGQKLQDMSMWEAGFKAIQGVTYKAPVGPWARDKKLAEVGRWVTHSLESDMEGYTLFLCTNVLGWTTDEHAVLMANVRKMIRSYRSVHMYFNARYVWGQKPDGAS